MRTSRLGNVAAGVRTVGGAEVRRLVQADAGANADPWKTEASLLGLCDRKGKRLATLSIWDLEDTEGVPGTPGSLRLVSPRLDMADAAGTTKVSLRASESESGLELLDEAANKRASLATGENDAPFLAMTGKEGHVTVHLGYFEADGGPALSLSDQEGHVRAELGSTELVTPKTGATRRTAEASLVFFDREDHVIFEAPPQ